MSQITRRSRLVLLVGIVLVVSSLGQECSVVSQPPVAVVGGDQTVNPGDLVRLDGSGSSAPNGDSLIFTWEQIGGDAVDLRDAFTAVASFTAPARTSDAVYSFQLTVSDGINAVVSSGVTITVRAAPPPTVDAGPDQSVDEGDPVTLNGSATGLNVTLIWDVPADSGVTLSSVTEPRATFTAPAVNEDTPVVLTLKATDSGGRTASDTVTITIRTLFMTGLLIPDPAELALLPQALNPSVGANLPPSVNLSGSLPPVGHQGNLGSCTAWATGYAGATYCYKVTSNADISSTANQASPMYVYYRTLEVQGSKCGVGTDMQKASDVLVKTGTPSLGALPYRDQCLTAMPSSAGADRFRIGTYKLLSTDRNSIRAELAAGRIVVFGSRLYSDFFKPPSGIYRGNGVLLVRSQQHAAHAMAIVGYDDAKGAFLIMNSWGTDWGSGGCLWWAYESLEKLMFVALSYTARNGTGPNGGGGSGDPITCSAGYQPALNNPSVCCDPAHPYYRSDGYCWSTPDPGNCRSGYKLCLNNAKLCCPDGCPYDNGDGHCRKDAPDGCRSGYSPAKNYPSVCCSDNFPYYNADHDWCQTTDPSLVCKAGYSFARNNNTVCCPDAYPYYYSDKKCYPVLCPTGSSPARNNLSVCCPSGYRYYYDGKCHKCAAGSSTAVNNSSICCPDGYPYYLSDGKCHKCAAGSSPAVNDSSVCCPSGYPYYLSDGKCHKCAAGSSPAVNNSSICCPNGYPYYGSDGKCHTSPTARAVGDGTAEGVPAGDGTVAEGVPPEDGTGDEGVPPAVGELEEGAPPGSDAVVPDAVDAPGGPTGVPPPSDEDFGPTGGGEIWNASAYQWLARGVDGAISVKLVFEGMLPSPIDAKYVTLIDPNGVQVTQEYHVAFSSGYVYFERLDGRQWLAGQYRLEMMGLTDGDREVTYSAQVLVPPLAGGPSLTGARAVGGDAAPKQVPVGDKPSAVAGDNGYPAMIVVPQ